MKINAKQMTKIICLNLYHIIIIIIINSMGVMGVIVSTAKSLCVYAPRRLITDNFLQQ